MRSMRRQSSLSPGIVPDPVPEPCATVLWALGSIPFRTNAAVLDCLSRGIEWLVKALDLVQDADAMMELPEEVHQVAPFVFELLCLHAVPLPGDCGSCAPLSDAVRSPVVGMWPLVGLPADAVLEVVSESGLVAVASLIRRFKAIVLAIGVHGGHQHPLESEHRPAPEPLAAIRATWTPTVALTFCRVLLTTNTSKGSARAFERCFFRANGLAPRNSAWVSVVAWFQSRIPVSSAGLARLGDTVAVESTAAANAKGFFGVSGEGGSAASRRSCSNCVSILAGELGARDPSGAAGIAEVHGRLAGLIRGEGAAALLGADAVAQFSRLRLVFREALLQFPSVLPWNVDCWIQAVLKSVGHGCAARSRRRILSELLASEFLQYLLSLLTTCSGWPDAGGLLELTFRVALHGHFARDCAPMLLLARNTLVESLIDRHGCLIRLAPWGSRIFSELRYPLGVLKMLRIRSGLSADPLEPSAVSDEDFDEAFVTVLAILSEPDSSDSVIAPGSTGDADLARELHALCRGSEQRWARMLASVAASAVSSGAGSPTQRLLVAFAELGADLPLASACLLAARAGVFSEAAAASVAGLLWEHAEVDVGDWLGLPGARAPPSPPQLVSLVQDPAARAEALPSPPQGAARYTVAAEMAPHLAQPSPISAALRPLSTEAAVGWGAPVGGHSFPIVDAEAELEPGGFHRGSSQYVHVSNDGLCARHLDDTGEDMHGVVISARPLVASRMGLYFEVQLLEARPEEMPDGLTIGVTATTPEAAARCEPATAEHLPHTWTVGYDGQLWDACLGELSSVDWDPRCLRGGDTVGVLVTRSEGELLIFRNGVACCPGPRGIPVGLCPLYAVVDLLGAARAVRWRNVEFPFPPARG